MHNILYSLKTSLKKANERDKKFERPVEKASRLIWPWPESKLLQFVGLMAVLDYVSTYIALEFSAGHQVYESGLMAKWALYTGGFSKLLFIDAAVIGGLVLLAVGVRYLYNRLGFPGFARAGFVFLFVPYAIIILPVVFNNILNILMSFR
jgi:hypothetical protein